MFSVIICQICGSSVPIEIELVLCCMAAEPVEVHPDHLDAVLDDGVLKEPRYCGVVCLDGRFGLFPSNFFECIAEWDHLTCCEIQGHEFCFGGGGHDELDGLGDCKNGSIGAWDWVIFGKVNMWAPAQLHKPGSVKKLASECIAKTIELAR